MVFLECKKVFICAWPQKIHMWQNFSEMAKLNLDYSVVQDHKFGVAQA